MISFQENISLKKYNTFRLDVRAKFFTEVFSVEDFLEAINSPQCKNLPILILGGGANILFTKNFDGLVIKNSLKGIKVVEENDDCVILEVAGGEDWPNFVEYTVRNNWAGVENLAYIPGTVGASPVQNIAAYGQCVEDTFESLNAVELKTGKIKTFSKEECKFKYRSSIFKQELKNKYFIVSTRFKLLKKFNGVNDTYHSRYESLKGELESFAVVPYTLKNIYDAVIRLRQKKLPDVSKVGTIGSTFANPFLNKTQLAELQKKFPDIQFYPINKMDYPKLDDPKLQEADIVKIPAGWLLEEAGWKNKRIGNVETHPHHALCVVTYNGATPEETFIFTEEMRKDFKEKYNIELEYEVNVI